jgi:Na+-translocating ferredoxin:NAD+ oxidoreductase subunit G
VSTLAPPPAAAPAEVPAWRLVSTLAFAGGLAGLLIVTVFQWTQPTIQAHQARVLAEAVNEVLAGPARTERLFVHRGALLAAPPPGADTMKIERVFQGFDDAGRPVGFALVGAEPGFADVVRLIFGYDAAGGRVLGMKVLESRETPGLGDKIEKDSGFVGAFRGVSAPIAPVKPGAGTGGAAEVETITGATISSRVVIGIVNRRIEALGPLLRAHLEGGTR